MRQALEAHTRGTPPDLDTVIARLGDVSTGARAQWGGEPRSAGGGGPRRRHRASPRATAADVGVVRPSDDVGRETRGDEESPPTRAESLALACFSTSNRANDALRRFM